MIEEVKEIGIPYLFRYRSNNDHTLNEIENAYIFFNNRESLNDPFDSSPNLIKLIKEKSSLENYHKYIQEQTQSEKHKHFLKENYTSSELGDYISEAIPKYINSRGIACFSMVPYVNMPLWANYANNHKGICLQHNLKDDESFFNGLRPVEYFKKLNSIEYTPSIDEDKITDVFFRKDIDWKYEGELRLVKDEIGKISFNRKSLRNIVCGYKCSNEYIEKIISICSKNYEAVGVYKMQIPKKQNKGSLIKMN